MIVIPIKMTFITVADDNDMLLLLLIKVIRTLSVCLFNNLFIIIIL